MRHHVHYITKRKGIYYYQRRIPSPIQDKYSKTKVLFSLKTRSLSIAKRKANVITHQLDKSWVPLLIEKSYLNEVLTEVQPAKFLSEAAKEFTEYKRLQLSTYTFSGFKGRIKRLVEILGDKPFEEVDSKDVEKIYQHLKTSRNLEQSTITNYMILYRAFYDFTCKKEGIRKLNPFNSIRTSSHPKNKRRPFSRIEIQRLISNLNPKIQIHQFIGLMVNTGLRLNEVCGLSTNELILDASVPHIHLQSTNRRRLKTPNSIRLVPLVGVSLTSAIEASKNSAEGAIFPDWLGTGGVPKSAMLRNINREIRKLSLSEKTSHSFRHSIRDRLRDVDCPSELIDSIGGWAYLNVGQGYGDGYSLEKKAHWLKLIDVKINSIE